ncbi:MAG: D-alanyl-D-alanine carboxypeptidase [Clostridiales bacterium]|nr:D-alanyl-D-alanine carboxypeptidase [Clostridiales bacterium]
MKVKFLKSGFLICCGLALAAMSGCGSTDRSDLTDAYDLYTYTNDWLSYGESSVSDKTALFAEDLCVGGLTNTESDQVDDSVAGSAAVFILDDGEISYAKDIYEKRYPASTTKIMTAYVALKYGDPSQVMTVSDTALSTLDPSSSVCGLKEGDQITLGEALYGLMLCSGNDAANVIAESIGGSQEDFVEMMNEEADALGCTGSHFTNAHGLPDEDHYTTAYDLYLIFNEALKNDDFVEVISADTHDASYLDADGNEVNVTWSSSDQYLTGGQDIPEGFTIIGGKTGTTSAAGYCLALYSLNSNGNPIISIVLGGDTRYDLYELMSNLLLQFAQ